MAWSPGENRFVTALSIAPVPDDASINTSFLVWNRNFKSSFASANMAENCGVLWCIIGYAIVNSAASGTGVGPGDNRYFFFTFSSLKGRDIATFPSILINLLSSERVKSSKIFSPTGVLTLVLISNPPQLT